MSSKRQKSSSEFKQEAVRLSQSREKKVEEIAAELGIHANTLYRWRQEVSQAGEQAFPGQGRLKPEEEEIRRLKRELEIVRQERDILKKTIVIFSQGSK